MHRITLPRSLAALVALAWALMATAAFAVPKTDVITMPNGDRITCEIKEMSYGKLSAKTDDMGTISIKWDKIVAIESRYWFRIRTKGGRLVYGQVQGAGVPGILKIVYREQETVLMMASIVEITPIRQGFWDKTRFSVALGYNWTQANSQTRSNVDLGFGYTGRIWSWGFDGSFILSEIEDKDTYRRLDSTLYLRRVISGSWFGMANSNAQRNDELGLLFRLSGVLSVGYLLVQSTHHELQLTAGISQNKEWATEDDLSENSNEIPLRMQYKVFRYDSPKTDITVRGGYMHNLTVKDRYRFDADIGARQEVIKDLFVELSYYISYDSQPPPGAQSNQDRGVTFSIGWSK